MDKEDSKPDPQDLDLGDSIDALLGDIDASCAQFDKKPEPEPDGSGLISDDGSQADISDLISEKDEGESDSAVKSETETESDSVGNDALEALDAVSQNAEALLDETIGELLDEDTAAIESVDDVVVSAEPEAESEGVTEVEDVEKSENEPVADTVVEEESVSEEESSTEEDAETVESETNVEDGVEADATEVVDEDLLDSVNEDLVNEIQDEQIETAQALDEDVEGSDVETGEASTPQADAKTEAASEIESSDNEGAAESGDLLGNLDDALAGIGDELMMGDFEDADGEIVDSESLEESIDPALILDQLNLSEEASTDDGDEGEGVAEPTEVSTGASTTVVEKTTTKPVKSAVTEQTNDSAPVAEPAEQIEKADTGVRVPDAIKLPDAAVEVTNDDDEVVSIWDTLLRVGKTRGAGLFALVKAEGGPTVARGVLALSKPLASKPASVRDSIGYVAIWTMFLAMVLWIYVMFFRTPPVTVPTQAPTRVVSPGDDLELIENHMATQPEMP